MKPRTQAHDRDEGATQMDSGTTESGTQVVDALEFDLTHLDSSSETNTVSVCSEIHRREDAPRNRRLRLVWNNECIPQWHHREVREAERFVRELADGSGVSLWMHHCLCCSPHQWNVEWGPSLLSDCSRVGLDYADVPENQRAIDILRIQI